MKPLCAYLLLMLQWLSLVWGAFTVLIALHLYSIDSGYFSTVPLAAPGADHYMPPIFHRLVVGLCTGFATMGIGGILFYLRRIYLVR
ncbi:hypothetical protein [Arenibacterium halophilum]|uniref:Inner membrane protein n=1 Tax=Arenibacterium halophilum TaxID=2583821 RepID=A0ABY2XE32_9RHOB|nr:hypothetical protein [Arenibacterium halophilum]TMV14913.1 hypothetical protein FGK64_02735 [Arenibacterium halophilum]